MKNLGEPPTAVTGGLQAVVADPSKLSGLAADEVCAAIVAALHGLDAYHLERLEHDLAWARARRAVLPWREDESIRRRCTDGIIPSCHFPSDLTWRGFIQRREVGVFIGLQDELERRIDTAAGNRDRMMMAVAVLEALIDEAYDHGSLAANELDPETLSELVDELIAESPVSL